MNNQFAKEEISVKKKQKRINRLVQFLSSVNISHQHDFEYFSLLAIVINSVQLVSYTFSFDIMKNYTRDLYLEWESMYKLLFYLFRPELYVIKQELGQLDLPLCIISALIIACILACGFISLVAKAKSQSRLIRVVKDLFFMLAIYYNSILYFPLIGVFSFLSIHGSFDTANSIKDQLHIVIVSAVMLLVSFVLSIYFNLWIEQSLIFTQKHVQRCQSSAYTILNNFLKLVIALVFSLAPKSTDVGAYCVVACQLIYMISELCDYFMNIPFIKRKQFYLVLVCHLVGCELILLGACSLVLELFDHRVLFNLAVGLSPLVCKLSVTLSQRFEFYIMFQVFSDERKVSSEQLHLLQKKVLFIYQYHKSFSQSERLHFIGMVENHKKQCQMNHRFCQVFSLIINDIENNQSSGSYFLNYRYVAKLLIALAKFDIEYMTAQIDKSQFFKLIKYMDFLKIMDDHYYAIQKINEIKNSLSDNQSQQLNLAIELISDNMLLHIRQHLYETTKQRIKSASLQNTIRMVSQYIQIDNNKSEIRELILSCLNYKIQCMEAIKKSFECTQDVLQLNEKLIALIEACEQKTLSLYNEYKTQTNVSLLSFFESEVKGNLNFAHLISTEQNILDLSNYYASREKLIDIYNKQVMHICVSMNQQNGKIISYDDKLCAYLGFTDQEMSYISDIKDLMPYLIASRHDEFVEYLAHTNQNNLIHKLRQFFIKSKNNFIITLEVFADFNIFYDKDFPLIFFLKPMQYLSGKIMVSDQKMIQGFDQQIFLNIGQQEVKAIPQKF